jgi:hypothetical protein
VHLYAINGGGRYLSDRQDCRTSVEMIEKHYAIRLKNTLDASAINVLKPKLKIKKKEPATTSRADYDDDL